MQKIVIITGATASGKTDYAVKYAKKVGGEIINCDSLQVYKDLKILTAHPTKSEMSDVKHRMFGYVDYDQKITAVDWAKMAVDEIRKIAQGGGVPIVVGGTGLYINTLINGISPLPEVSQKTRENSALIARCDYEHLCRAVYENDPRIEKIISRDKHRQMIRAFEILSESGKSILHFYELPKIIFLRDALFEFIVLENDRNILYTKINARFDMMLERGVVDEMHEFLLRIREKSQTDRPTDHVIDRPNEVLATTKTLALPVFRAIGAKEIAMYVDKKCTFDSMKTAVATSMRNYAKRQLTWFRHKIPTTHNVTCNFIQNCV